eukprot:13391546-Heterocapsa_arctica.AAC.1
MVQLRRPARRGPPLLERWGNGRSPASSGKHGPSRTTWARTAANTSRRNRSSRPSRRLTRMAMIA